MVQKKKLKLVNNYMKFLKNGTQEERDKISHCINDLITAGQEKARM